MTKSTPDGLRPSLEDEFDCYVAANAAEAMEYLNNDRIDVMLTDLRVGEDNVMKLLDAALAPPECTMMTAYGSVKLIPAPPAFRLIRKTGTLPVWNS